MVSHGFWLPVTETSRDYVQPTKSLGELENLAGRIGNQEQYPKSCDRSCHLKTPLALPLGIDTSACITNTSGNRHCMPAREFLPPLPLCYHCAFISRLGEGMSAWENLSYVPVPNCCKRGWEKQVYYVALFSTLVEERTLVHKVLNFPKHSNSVTS